MATTPKTKAENLSVESRLKSLYKLQTILSEIDRIRFVRGELPFEVRDLEDQIEGLHTRIEKYRADIEEFRRKSAAEQNHILDAQKQIETYRQQIDNVRNNREYDLLTKEVEYQTLEIELAEKHINEYARAIDTKTAEIEATESELVDRNHILDEKRQELEEIVNETKQDEEKLRAEALALEPKIDERTLNAFKRIRKNARNGLGIVYIQRNACGGCFNRIPPQRQMEIKMHKKIIVCEYCGRIMIDPELAGVKIDVPVSEKPARAKRTVRKSASKGE
ncbi:MAG: hypothetical protein HFJ93_06455 [Muribaculaceae bacterium]|jgi:predicted  nucleic acid-binding Zn-ribbon protein|nr:hypothetical protein [Muribaculaceae bacterium]